MVYEPREDSEFLAGFVEREARGIVLDMGTGSGVQALAALKSPETESVLAVDVDASAVARARETLPKSVRVIRSDMFGELGRLRFDTIVCNPPYLPDDPDVKDRALDGGPRGFDFVERFLRDSREHLEDGGQIIFLFSSLTNKERVDMLVKELGYSAEMLGELAMFFERLYVYRVVPCV